MTGGVFSWISLRGGSVAEVAYRAVLVVQPAFALLLQAAEQ